jgi:hypothetical protein
VADYTISTYFHADDGVYVNLFTPSEVNWKVQEAPVKLTQKTSYPESDSTELQVEVAAPREFTIYVRIPGWLRSPAQLAVNGKTLSVDAQPGNFAALRRRWQTNDTVEIQLPFSFRLEAIDEQHPGTAALVWGPLMLVAIDPPLELARKSVFASPEGFSTVSHSPLTFEMAKTPGNIRFVPFYRIQDETYTTYVQTT